ncbi:hypothetical protein ACJX0J_029222, partial [Zea mays]
MQLSHEIIEHVIVWICGVKETLCWFRKYSLGDISTVHSEKRISSILRGFNFLQFFHSTAVILLAILLRDLPRTIFVSGRSFQILGRKQLTY